MSRDSRVAKLNFRLGVAVAEPAGDVRGYNFLYCNKHLLSDYHPSGVSSPSSVVLNATRFSLQNTRCYLASFYSPGCLGGWYYCVPQRALFLATPPANVSKSKRNVSARYLTHKQRSYTMRGSIKGCQPHFRNSYAQNVDSWPFVVRASNIGLLSNRPAQDAIYCRFSLI